MASGLVALLLGAHRLLPDLGGVTPVVESVLPWFGAAVPVLLGVACLTRSWPPVAATLVPALVWAFMFAPAFFRTPPGGPSDLSVLTLNVDAANDDPEETLRGLVKDRDLIALQEMTGPTRDRVSGLLRSRFPHHFTVATVGLWSRFPIVGARRVDVGLGWTRALRAVVRTPKGRVTVYVMHLASARPGETGDRDHTLAAARKLIEDDDSKHLLLLGDLNTATTDRQRNGLVPPLSDAQQEAGTGFGFTWPAGFPITRPDHILYRGLVATRAGVAPAPGSDHRAAFAGLRL
ncbi:teicoplanin resistance protein VanJ [Microtetraspora sp. NBRC 13810]|nr:teicoplanin resistance protein VanJ [Microtetraspora sp. NBRC 13810]